MATVPTSITDKNGKLTTVHKNVDNGVSGNIERVATVPVTTSYDEPMAFDEASAEKYVSEQIASVSAALVLNPRRSYGELSVGDDVFLSEAVWFQCLIVDAHEDDVLEDHLNARFGNSLPNLNDEDINELTGRAMAEVVLWLEEFGTGDAKASADGNIAMALTGEVSADNIFWTAALHHLRAKPEEIASFDEDAFYEQWYKGE